MNKLLTAAIAGAFVVTTGLATGVAAQPAKATATHMKDAVTSKVNGERAEENTEDRAERQYEAAKEKSEDTYDVAREQCEKQKMGAERACKQQARAKYKDEVARAKVERKKMKADAHMMGETGKPK